MIRTLFFICLLSVISFSSLLIAQQNPLKDNDRSLGEARGELLQMLMSDLKLRSDNELCVFNDYSSGFSKAVVSPCKSLFDKILVEALEGEISHTLLDNQISRSLLRYLLLELAYIRSFPKSKAQVDFTKNEIDSLDKSIEEHYIRVIRVSTVLLRISNVKEDTDIRARVFEAILNSYDELIAMLFVLGEETSVVSLGEILLAYEHEFNAKGHRGQLLMLVLSILYKDETVMSAHLERLASEYRMRMFDLLETDDLVSLLDKNNESFSELSRKNVNYVKNVLDFYKSCPSVYLKGEISASSFCSEFPWSTGPALRLLFSDLFLLSLATDLEVRPLRAVKDVRLRLPDFVTGSEPFHGFREMIILPALEKLKLSEPDALKACEILHMDNSTCTLIPGEEETLSVQSFSKGKMTYLVLALSFAFIVMVFLYLKLPHAFIAYFKSLYSYPRPEEQSNSLSAEERKELRELRAYFKLNPAQGLEDLQKRYRRYVLKTHPDRLRDEGEAFILLQERFERAKILLDRLEDEREKRLSNDLN